MSLTVKEPLERWRLLLGEAAQDSCGELGADAAAADAALDWLYGRDSDLGGRGERGGGRSGGMEQSQLTVPDSDYFIWLTGEGTVVKSLTDGFVTDAIDPQLVRSSAYWHAK